MWQLKHQGWARRFVLDAVAERASPPRAKKGKTPPARSTARLSSSKRTQAAVTFRAEIAQHLQTVVKNARAQLARPAGRIKIVNGKLDQASLLVVLAGDALTRDRAAHWLADQLRLPLYSVSLEAWIAEGWTETERNLDRVFKAAERGDVVLYFEDAELLFGISKKTTQAQTRVTNALLQHIALSRGLVLLAVSGRKKIEPVWVHYADDFIEL